MAGVSTPPLLETDPEAAPVLTERRGPAGEVLVVTINRPHARNAVTRAVSDGIAAAMDELDGNPEIRAAILTGAAGTFCAGMDLKAFVRGEDPYVPGRGFAGLAFAPPSKPLIAAVEGWALAGGCEIVLSCDLVVAAESAKFGIPEVKRGLAAAAGGLFRLPLRIPYHVAMELVLTGDPVEAPRAYELGLTELDVPDVVLHRRLHRTNLGRADRAARGDYARLLKEMLDRRRRAAELST